MQAHACRTQIILGSSPHGSYLVPRFLFSGPFPLFSKSLPLPFHFPPLRTPCLPFSPQPPVPWMRDWRVTMYVRVCWEKNLCLEDNLNIHEKMIHQFNSFTSTHLLVKTRRNSVKILIPLNDRYSNDVLTPGWREIGNFLQRGWNFPQPTTNEQQTYQSPLGPRL